MSIDLIKLKRIECLANIKLNKEEKNIMIDDLNSLLIFFQCLDSLEMSNIEPTILSFKKQPHYQNNNFDKINSKKDILYNAPESSNNFFVIPKVIEQ